MITRQYLLGIACVVMGYCGSTPTFNVFFGTVGVYLLWSENRRGKGGR